MSDPIAARLRIVEIMEALEEISGLMQALEQLEVRNPHNENSAVNTATIAVRSAIRRAQDAAGFETIS